MNIDDAIERAASARSAGMRETLTGLRSPRDRRCQRDGTGSEQTKYTPGIRSAIEVRAGSSDGTVGFVGTASAYETPYVMYDMFGAYNEVVSAGAGAKSLKTKGLQVPLVIQHDQSKRIAATWVKNGPGQLFLSEDDDGLQVDAPDLDQKDVDVQAILPKLRSGLVNEMSFAFRIDVGTWSPDYSEFRIQQYDINRGDVAIVGFGANPYTTAKTRATPEEMAEKRAADQERARLKMILDLELSR